MTTTKLKTMVNVSPLYVTEIRYIDATCDGHSKRGSTPRDRTT